MKIKIYSRHFKLTRELTEFIKKRASFAFRQHRERIRSIVFTLSDVNGPKGGNDKQCRVAIQVKGAGDVVIEQNRPQLAAAIHTATVRASNTVSRKTERVRRKIKRLREKSSFTDVVEMPATD